MPCNHALPFYDILLLCLHLIYRAMQKHLLVSCPMCSGRKTMSCSVCEGKHLSWSQDPINYPPINTKLASRHDQLSFNQHQTPYHNLKFHLPLSHGQGTVLSATFLRPHPCTSGVKDAPCVKATSSRPAPTVSGKAVRTRASLDGRWGASLGKLDRAGSCKHL